MRTLFVVACCLACAAACAGDTEQTTTSSNGGAAGNGGAQVASTSSAGGSTTEGIACGNDACDVAAGEVCCISGPQLERHSCVMGTCPSGSVTAACDGPEDCSVGICCGGDVPFTASCVDFVGNCDPFYQYCHNTEDCPRDTPFCCALEGSSSRICTPNRITNCGG